MTRHVYAITSAPVRRCQARFYAPTRSGRPATLASDAAPRPGCALRIPPGSPQVSGWVRAITGPDLVSRDLNDHPGLRHRIWGLSRGRTADSLRVEQTSAGRSSALGATAPRPACPFEARTSTRPDRSADPAPQGVPAACCWSHPNWPRRDPPIRLFLPLFPQRNSEGKSPNSWVRPDVRRRPRAWSKTCSEHLNVRHPTACHAVETATLSHSAIRNHSLCAPKKARSAIKHHSSVPTKKKPLPRPIASARVEPGRVADPRKSKSAQ